LALGPLALPGFDGDGLAVGDGVVGRSGGFEVEGSGLALALVADNVEFFLVVDGADVNLPVGVEACADFGPGSDVVMIGDLAFEVAGGTGAAVDDEEGDQQ